MRLVHIRISREHCTHTSNERKEARIPTFNITMFEKDLRRVRIRVANVLLLCGDGEPGCCMPFENKRFKRRNDNSWQQVPSIKAKKKQTKIKEAKK